ncbi:hypothetical protein CKA32_005922 [Geitlerinema sp. FC II]|nr:hypothetical protein CKA32_005922 [Geitlerinema sp. FC II]
MKTGNRQQATGNRQQLIVSPPLPFSPSPLLPLSPSPHLVS